MTAAREPLAQFDRAAQHAAAVVIGEYSTSFALACRLLGRRVRVDIRSIYALVRVADEIVDGSAAGAGLAPAAQREVLDELEAETLSAVSSGFSGNLIVHAFARTARTCDIGPELIMPFFRAMRTDLDVSVHDRTSHDDYVYGSAEVVGLMCLKAFRNAGRAQPAPPDALLEEGARRLGRAFQDVNFLRDIAQDRDRLGRDYLAVDSTDGRTAVLDRIDDDLAAASLAVAELPDDCRRAVTAAHDLFAELSRRLRERPGSERVRVPDAVKAAIVARAWLGFAPRRTS
ncbi:phytoene/squalene synthase family protein [Microbacterium fluvii]|uniref:phytoene/squalene synthase family protein n=1 Tax=Microbacterium fluvii TaxID=415215 RepID=UPI0031E7853A